MIGMVDGLNGGATAQLKPNLPFPACWEQGHARTAAALQLWENNTTTTPPCR